MTRGHSRLRKYVAVVLVAAGTMLGAVQPANAATGAGGVPILYASSQNQAHQCNVIGGDSSYQAVVCSDLITYEGATDYYAYGREEAICQTTNTHTVVPCQQIREYDFLAAGDGTSTAGYSQECYYPSSNLPNCPAGRYYLSTRNWVYSIADAQGGRCSSNVSSSYVLWNVALHGYNAPSAGTEIWTPDGHFWSLGVTGTANDWPNESSGHYFICP